ncbi:LPS export ABC transporter periplasmic protein LptC [Arhodomonas aquaeolei]|uniref:LPS export ABC transporter periplasmic protein LptC n=1 Tax=Arhodomonas aquaeolei TaxID=2369 RepID=UPI0003821137|nr:LPS export ABC transporter periplasmic protein LptC [Arhodomonas aquaeolei]
MRERSRRTFPLVVTALLVALAWFSFGGRDDGGTGTAPPVREPEARYYATEVRIVATDADGNPSDELRAQRAAYFPGADRWEMQQPRWQGRRNGRPWHGRARRAEATPIGDHERRIVLNGDVELHREAPDPLTLLTDTLTLEPARDYAETDAAVTLRTPASEMTGVGARAWMDRQQVRLLAKVRGTYATE